VVPLFIGGNFQENSRRGVNVVLFYILKVLFHWFLHSQNSRRRWMSQDDLPTVAADHRDLHQFASAPPPLTPPSSPTQAQVQQQQQQLGTILPAFPITLEYPRLPRLSTAFLRTQHVNGNINRQMMLLYNPNKISYSTHLPTLFSEVEPRESLKHTIFAALQHISFLIYVFRYRREIKLEPIAKTTVVVNAEMNIHKTPDQVLQHVEEICQYCMRQSVKPTLQTLFSMCMYYKRNDFLSKDGELIILQSTTLQTLVEISRCVERLTKQSYSSIFFRVDASKEETDYNEVKLWALHCEIGFIRTPLVFREEF
jgi:hypothetical protein